jgi:hypothetical protein
MTAMEKLEEITQELKEAENGRCMAKMIESLISDISRIYQYNGGFKTP